MRVIPVTIVPASFRTQQSLFIIKVKCARAHPGEFRQIMDRVLLLVDHASSINYNVTLMSIGEFEAKIRINQKGWH